MATRNSHTDPGHGAEPKPALSRCMKPERGVGALGASGPRGRGRDEVNGGSVSSFRLPVIRPVRPGGRARRATLQPLPHRVSTLLGWIGGGAGWRGQARTGNLPESCPE